MRTTNRTTGKNTRKTYKRRPSVTGEFKSGIAKKKASRDRVKNPRAKKALSKRHPKTPTYRVPIARL